MSASDVVWSFSWPEMEVEYVSPSAEALFGRPLEDLVANHSVWKESVHPEDKHSFVTAWDELANKGIAEREYRIVRPDGTVVWIEETCNYAFNTQGKPTGVTGVSRNITNRKNSSDSIAGLLSDKDLTLSEVRHSVKNNLSAITSLLGFHARIVDDPAATAAIEDVSRRVQAMMAIYDRLCRSDDYCRMPAVDSITPLGEHTISSSSNRIAATSEVTIDNLILDVEAALHCFRRRAAA